MGADDIATLHGKVSVTDRYVKFFNLVLDDIQRDYPNVGLSFYCYSQHMRPPVREKPNSKILPVLAPIDICRLHDIDNPHCWERQYIKKIIEGWKALDVKMMYRGYLFNLADHGLPFSMIQQVHREYPYYHQQDMIACRVECHPAWAYHGPSLYLAAKIMWNPALDVDATLDDYFSRVYGPAARPMRTHFEILESAIQKADYHTSNVFDMSHILTPKVMDKMKITLQQAENLAIDDSIYVRRVNMIRIGYDYGVANLAMMAAVKNFDSVLAKEQLDLITKEIGPKALAHEPPLISRRYGDVERGFINRFWQQTVEPDLNRTTNGNELVAKLPDEWFSCLIRLMEVKD